MFAFRGERGEEDTGTGGSGGAQQQQWWPPEADDPRRAGRNHGGNENGRMGESGYRSTGLDEPASSQHRWAELLAEAQKRVHGLERRLISEEDRSRSLQTELEQLAGELHNERLYSARLRQRLNHQRQALEEERNGGGAGGARAHSRRQQLEADASALELRAAQTWMHPSEMMRIQPCSDPRDYPLFARPSSQLLAPPFPRNLSPVAARHAIMEEDIANFRSAAEAGRHHRRHSPPLVGPSGVYHSEFNPMGGGARSSAMVFSGLEEQPMARRGNGGSFPSRPGSAGVLMSRGMLERAERYGSPRETRERSAVWEDMALM